MSLEEKIRRFNPNDAATNDSNLFGLPFTVDESRVVIVPVPWEVTVSYGGGTARAPEAILAASLQVDLFDPYFPNAWKIGVALDRMPSALTQTSRRLRRRVVSYLDQLAQGKDNAAMEKTRREVNAACEKMVAHVRKTTGKHLDDGKLVSLIGGDHSTPLGFMQALAERHSSFGILQLDAHADLRNAFEGFEYSHASIMFNALKIRAVAKLVQVGIRDYCAEEVDVIEQSRGRVVTHFDRDIKRAVYAGKSIASLHQAIVRQLPKKVYVSFDIDGLDPKLCPHTGTPVAGGMEFEESVQLLQAVADSGRTIVGFDINEVSPREDEWDANVGSRLLFRLINIMAKSNGIRPK
jgi:agmatinase